MEKKNCEICAGILSTFYAFPRGLFDSSISLISCISLSYHLSHIMYISLISSLSYHIYIDCKPLFKEIFLAQTHSWDLKTVLPTKTNSCSHSSPTTPSVTRKTASRRPTSTENFLTNVSVRKRSSSRKRRKFASISARRGVVRGAAKIPPSRSIFHELANSLIPSSKLFPVGKKIRDSRPCGCDSCPRPPPKSRISAPGDPGRGIESKAGRCTDLHEAFGTAVCVSATRGERVGSMVAGESAVS